AYLLLRLLQEDPQRAFDHVEGVLDIAVVVPRHFLARADLQLRNAEARSRAVLRTPLDVIEGTCVLHCGSHGRASVSSGSLELPSRSERVRYLQRIGVVGVDEGALLSPFAPAQPQAVLQHAQRHRLLALAAAVTPAGGEIPGSERRLFRR